MARPPRRRAAKTGSRSAAFSAVSRCRDDEESSPLGKRLRPITQGGLGGKRKLSAARRRAAVAAAIKAAYRSLALSSGQLGKIGEGLVYKVATLESDGELVFYTPVDDNEGTDFVVKRRYRAAVLKLQVKARESQRTTGAFEVSIRASTIPPNDPKLLVVVNFVPGRPDADLTVWVIPSAAFAKFASLSAGQYQALLSPSRTARDRWVKYRHEMREISAVFLALLDEAERGEKPTRRPGPPAPRRGARRPRDGRRRRE